MTENYTWGYVSALFVYSHTAVLLHHHIWEKIADGQIKLSLVDFNLIALISKSKWQRTTHEAMSVRSLARATLAVMLHHHIWEKIDDVQIKLSLVDFGLIALISKSKWQRTTHEAMSVRFLARATPCCYVTSSYLRTK
jgi:hypothetical protein